jgi:hypothetical protein
VSNKTWLSRAPIDRTAGQEGHEALTSRRACGSR